MKKLVDAFNPSPETDHFALITFNSKANLVFNFNQYETRDALLQKIAAEPIDLEKHTRTDLALRMAKDELFTEAGGDRPDKPDILLIFTDGKPTHPQGNFNFTAFAEEMAKYFKASICSAVQCCEVPCCAVLCGIVRYRADLCCAVLCNAV